MSAGSSTSLRAVQSAGVAVWLDDLDRSRLTTGGLQGLVDDGVISGVTTNPAIFAKAIVHGGDAYSDALDAAATGSWSADETVHRLIVDDVRHACDVLAPVYARTGRRDGFVSIEVDPRLAHNTEATIEAARLLWREVDRLNAMIKIPATVEGLPAITAALADGINVNVTLIFTRARYEQVRAAHRAGLAAAREAGHDLASIASVASFFVSRWDSAVDQHLPPEAGGTVAVSNAHIAYADFMVDRQGAAWVELAAHGAQPQRPLWASTGTKNPSYSATKYVEELLTPDSVNTMPEATLQALIDTTELATLGDTVDVDGVLAAAGLDYATVGSTLERDGVQAFVDAWNELLVSVEASLAARR